MKFKTNIAIGAVFVALLAFVYFYEIKGGEERRQEAEKSKQLFVFQEDDAQRLELLRGDDILGVGQGDGRLEPERAHDRRRGPRGRRALLAQFARVRAGKGGRR